MRRVRDDFRLDAAMRRFAADPEASLTAGNGLLGELIEGWGNSGWSAQQDYLRACLEAALTTSGPILECGSGLSTLLLGAVARQRGCEHWALEHMEPWAAKIEKCVARHDLRATRICVAPLRRYAGFDWYDPPLASMQRAFSLVVCDGPPAHTRGGRYGLLPVMRNHLAPGCVILLDDAEREHERAIAWRWQAEAGASHEVVQGAKPFIRLVMAASAMPLRRAG
jgi:hypothetical protein